MTTQTFGERVGFCVGTGRCGTTLLATLAGLEPAVAASHERLRLAATFHMFCKWNDIPIDPEGFLVDRQEAVLRDLASRPFSFESSALLSHSIAELSERFSARFLLLVRRPDQTVASFAVRKWFVHPIARGNPDLPPSYREGEEPRHFFGRNLPRGAEFERWSALSQIGKLGWFWAARNTAILEQFAWLPPERCRIERLEDLSVQRYREIAAFFGWPSSLSEAAFHEVADARPNAGPHPPRGPEDWTSQESAEFEAEVGSLAGALGYEHRVSVLTKTTETAPRPRISLPEVLARLGIRSG